MRQTRISRPRKFFFSPDISPATARADAESVFARHTAQDEGSFQMEQSGRERRLKPRFNAELPCTIALAEAERDLIFPNEKLVCRTRDLSESGVGLAADTIYLGYTCVVDEGCALMLRLELPNGVVEMEATTAHYLRLGDDAQAAQYLIGLRITSISKESHSLYISYLEELNK
jgi:hypothetical protein